jgi:hypothetical protein
MPAITRSQSKINANARSVRPTKVAKQSIKPSVVEVSNIVDGNYKYASESEYPNTLSVKLDNFVTYITNISDISNQKINSDDYYTNDTIYFDNIRLITELYYYIYESIDTIFIIDGLVGSPDIQNIINIIYLRTITLLKGRNRQKENTYEQKYIVNCCLQQIQETQDKLYQYVTEKPKRFPKVSYAEICEVGEDYIQDYDPDYNPDNEDDLLQLLQDKEDDKKFDEFVENEYDM